jgi:predicted nucleic acid-binding protein
MSDDIVYIDSSAFVKLFLPEPESPDLKRFIEAHPHRVSAMLLRTEVIRAAVRATLSPQRMLLVRRLLDGVSFLTADRDLSDDAGTLHPPELRSLDAIHLAAARSLGTELSALVTYDARLAQAATWYGLPVLTPC